SKSSSTTKVPREEVSDFVQAAALVPYEGVVSLTSVVESLLEEDDDRFIWQKVEATRTGYVHWILVEKDSMEPLTISHVAVLSGAMSRSYGNYIPSGERAPEEYPINGMLVFSLLPSYVVADMSSDTHPGFTNKLTWNLESSESDSHSIGPLMQRLERSLIDGPLQGAFAIDTPPEQLRDEWNQPNEFSKYHLQFPLFARRYVAKRRGKYMPAEDKDSVVHPRVQAALEVVSKGEDPLVLVPCRPSVYVKKGAYNDPSAKQVLATSEDDWHRRGDIIWFVGQIHCEAYNTTTAEPTATKRVHWTCEWWPESVVRIARVDIPVLHAEGTTEENSKKRKFSDVGLSPRKKPRFDPNLLSSPSKASTSAVVSESESRRSGSRSRGMTLDTPQDLIEDN
ncbi:10903_t:CDS:2, partial [Acaulospora colombiana]